MAIVDAVNRAAKRVPPGLLYVLGAIAPLWLLWRAQTGALGVDPVKAIEHRLGLWALQLVVLGLCVTPLRRLAGINLIRFRRAIGLLAFFFACLHVLAWLVLDMGLLWQQALADIVKRPYITLGMASLLMMIPLAVTSRDSMIRRLGPERWRQLHRLNYLLAPAAALHFLWLVKAWPLEPILYLTAILVLLALRFVSQRGRVAA